MGRMTRKSQRLIAMEADEDITTLPGTSSESSQSSGSDRPGGKSRWRNKYKLLRILGEIGRAYLLLSLITSLRICESQESHVETSESVLKHHVTISTSYSSTNLAALPNINNPGEASDVNFSQFSNSSRSNVLPKINTFTPVSRVTTNSNNNRRRAGLRSSSINANNPNYNYNSQGHQEPKTDTFEKRIFNLPSFLGSLSNLQSSWKPSNNQLLRDSPSRSDEVKRSSTTVKPEGDVSSTSKAKPTMTPLRVLQTEINHTATKRKPGSKKTEKLEPIETQTPRTLTSLKSSSSHSHQGAKSKTVGDKNLANHRLEPTPVSQDVQDQLNLINQRFSIQLRNKTDASVSLTTPAVKTDKPKKEKSKGGASIGRSPPHHKEESKQLKFDHPFNYMAGYTDNIAEEDRFQGITDTGHRYPGYYTHGNYDDQLSSDVYPTMMGPNGNLDYEPPSRPIPPNSPPPTGYYNPQSGKHGKSKTSKKSKTSHKNKDKHRESPGGSTNHPSVSSSNNQPQSHKAQLDTPPSQQPQISEPIVSSATQQDNYLPPYPPNQDSNFKPQYYSENGVGNNYHANDPRRPNHQSHPEASNYAQTNPYGHLPPSHQYSPYPATDYSPQNPQNPSQDYNNQQYPTASNYDPRPPPPYRGDPIAEGSTLSNQKPDTIMDRFEVFYAEHKLLTWGAFFVLGGLALATIVVYMWINNPPTEVVTARDFVDHYLLKDPAILKFLSTLMDFNPSPKETGNSNKSRRARKRLPTEGATLPATSPPALPQPQLVIQKAKAL